MKILKNKFLIGLICIILGLVVGFIAIPQIQNRDQMDLTKAIRLKQSILHGGQITDDMVEQVEVSRRLIPEGTLTSLSSVSSRYAVTDLYAGDYLTAEKMTDLLSVQDQMAMATAKGLKVVSITLPTLASGVSGKLQPGDIVTVMAMLKNNSADQSQTLEPEKTAINETNPDNSSNVIAENETLIYPELQYIEVCSLSASDGSDARVNKTVTDESKNLLPTTVSLFVSEAQALRLAELEQKGLIHLSFVARGKDTAQFIPDDRRVLSMEVG